MLSRSTTLEIWTPRWRASVLLQERRAAEGPTRPRHAVARADIVPSDGSAPVRFATRDGNSFFTGGLDEVAIYPTVLTGAEIMENYTAGIS